MNSWPFFRASSLVAITFLALHGTVWLWSLDRLTFLINQEADRLRNQGWRVDIAAARYGGWPGQARVEVGPATITAHGLTVRAESLIAEAALVRPGPLTWRSRSHVLRFGSGPERPVLAGNVAGEDLPDGVLLTTAAMRVAGLLEAEALRAQIRPDGTTLTVQRFRPLAAGWALGPAIENVEIRIKAESPTASAAVLRWPAPPQAEGDHFDVELMHAAAVGMEAAGRAKLWFDAALRPSVDGVIKVTGYAAGLDGLAAADIFSARTAVAAKAVLDLLATPPGGAAEIAVQIEGGIVYAAQFPLLRLPQAQESDLGPLR